MSCCPCARYRNPTALHFRTSTDVINPDADAFLCVPDRQRGFQPSHAVSWLCIFPLSLFLVSTVSRVLLLTCSPSSRSLVGFGPKSRYLGEAAKTQEISNLKNTVGSLKRLAGRSFKDPDVQIEQQFVSAPLVDCNGQVGAEVNYMGKKERFTATQLVAMFLTKIKQTTAAEIKLPVTDLVMSVPPWFTDEQRRALLDAAEIADLKLLRLMNDTTAAALGYGITKLDLPTAEEKPRRVALIDVGHSNFTCSIVEFKKGELAVKATAFDRHFGGRNFDKTLVDHLHKEFLGKYKIDISTNPKAMTRVFAAAEKLKKILSANQQAPLNIESLMNDVDVHAMITRPEFEAMVEPLLNRVHVPLEQALADAMLTKEDIDVVELVGGGSRVPAVKDRIQAFFGKQLSFTMNQDEAVARGCAFSCAILSPVFKVRDFSVQDIVQYPIEFCWEKAPDIPDEDTSLVVFNKGNVMPSTKILTFYRKQPFDLEARYSNPAELPGVASPWIGRFSVKGVKASGSPDDFMICKLKARVNIHGVLNVESGYYVEDQEVEEPIEEEKDGGEKKDPNVSDALPPSMPCVKALTPTCNRPWTPTVPRRKLSPRRARLRSRCERAIFPSLPARTPSIRPPKMPRSKRRQPWSWRTSWLQTPRRRRTSSRPTSTTCATNSMSSTPISPATTRRPSFVLSWRRVR